MAASKIRLPVVGHIAMWGLATGDLHQCVHDAPHEGPCICKCGTIHVFATEACR